MTEPLCDLPQAEQTCEHSFAEALKIDPDNIDAKQGLAQLRILRGRDSEANKLLQSVVQKLNELQEKVQANTFLQNMDRMTSEELPSQEFRYKTCDLLVQLKKFKPAIQILELLVQEDDENLNVWYLLAFCLFK